jgi:hypothetical protein
LLQYGRNTEKGIFLYLLGINASLNFFCPFIGIRWLDQSRNRLSCARFLSHQGLGKGLSRGSG